MSKYIPNYRQAAASVAFLTIIFTAGLTDGFNCFQDFDGPDVAEEKKEQILTSIEKEDFISWKNNIGQQYLDDANISPQDFQEFVQIRKTARSGYYQKSISMANRLQQKIVTKFQISA